MARSKRNKRERKEHHRWLLENGWCKTWAAGVYRGYTEDAYLWYKGYPLLSRRRGGSWVLTAGSARVSPPMPSPQAALAYAALANWGLP